MTELSDRLTAIGDVLHAAARTDLHGSTASPRHVRKVAVALAVCLVGPTAAVAATQLLSGSDVARSMPAGTLAFADAEPSCTVVTDGVEYHCTLAHPPQEAVDNWLGTVESTVDGGKHINGGCRSTATDGMTWQCYLGRAAVDQRIISADFLGEYAPTPAVG